MPPARAATLPVSAVPPDSRYICGTSSVYRELRHVPVRYCWQSAANSRLFLPGGCHRQPVHLFQMLCNRFRSARCRMPRPSHDRAKSHHRIQSTPNLPRQARQQSWKTTPGRTSPEPLSRIPHSIFEQVPDRSIFDLPHIIICPDHPADFKNHFPLLVLSLFLRYTLVRKICLVTLTI